MYSGQDLLVTSLIPGRSFIKKKIVTSRVYHEYMIIN